jgi:hypothetical protein
MSDYKGRPITALRRVEADLSLLRIEVRNLAAQVAQFDEGVRQSRRDLEALAQLFQREFRQREEQRREEERAEHVREELFNYELNQPQGDNETQ